MTIDPTVALQGATRGLRAHLRCAPTSSYLRRRSALDRLERRPRPPRARPVGSQRAIPKPTPSRCGATSASTSPSCVGHRRRASSSPCTGSPASWTNGASWNTYDGTHAWTTPGGDFDADAGGDRDGPRPPRRLDRLVDHRACSATGSTARSPTTAWRSRTRPVRTSSARRTTSPPRARSPRRLQSSTSSGPRAPATPTPPPTRARTWTPRPSPASTRPTATSGSRPTTSRPRGPGSTFASTTTTTACSARRRSRAWASAPRPAWAATCTCTSSTPTRSASPAATA